MIDPRLSKLAQVIVRYSLDIKRNDRVLIQSPVAATPLIQEVYRETIKAGAFPTIIANLEGIQEIFFQEAQEHQLDDVNPIMEFVIDNYQCFSNIMATDNTRKLTDVPPEKQARVQKAQAEIFAKALQKMATKELRWNLAPFPTQAMAQEASMSLYDYSEYVFSTLRVNEEDPISEWKRMEQEQAGICEYLEKKSELHFVGDKTDLTMSVAGRKWDNCCGKQNLPDGEVYTAPVEDSVNGTIRFTLPGIYQGKEIEDIQLTFKDGEVIEATASKGAKLLEEILEVPGAKVLGEVAIGTNFGINRFIKNMLFDEKMGGYIHMALGAAFPETGGLNKSGVHWDILKDMRLSNSYIEADGEKFYVEGQFSLK
ncbi:MAG: aminopeptidase [Promethearchaeota archaeon]